MGLITYIILNNGYNCVKQEKHDWIQSIQYLLSLNGVGNSWLQPPLCNNSIIKSYGRIFSKCAEEQYIQEWNKKCLLSKTTYLLSNSPQNIHMCKLLTNHDIR